MIDDHSTLQHVRHRLGHLLVHLCSIIHVVQTLAHSVHLVDPARIEVVVFVEPEVGRSPARRTAPLSILAALDDEHTALLPLRFAGLEESQRCRGSGKARPDDNQVIFVCRHDGCWFSFLKDVKMKPNHSVNSASR